MSIPLAATVAFFCAAHAASLADQQARIEKACASDTFSGAVLVAKPGRPVWTYACGLADRENKVAMRADTPMRIASMGKLFTTTAVLQLYEAGKIDLDAPLARYIPDYPNKELAEKVKIRHLLTHTGGTGDIFGPEGFAHRHELRRLADYVRVFGKRPLSFEPGSKQEYSNYGYILLGMVIQNVSGEDYYNYVQRHILDVAGMRSTSFPVEAELSQAPSNGYTRASFAPGGVRIGGPLTRVGLDELPYRATPAGGCFSTVGDLNRFAQALLDGRLISPAMLDRVLSGQLSAGLFSYGFGRGTDAMGRTWIGFAGGAPGTNGELKIFPKQHLVVATLANLDPPAATDLTTGLATAD
ncbi:MAG: beta-lactamase family protein [Alphaproteobacteria bacterium]|nr:beta-lactamase family protein [Alphaproteobacteria bacterium]